VATIFHQDGMDFTWTVDAFDQNLLDIGSPAGARNENHGTVCTGVVRRTRNRKLSQHFIERANNLVPPEEGNVDRWRE
jgi:hypothetical protein